MRARADVKTREWGAFVLLSLLWGTSYLWIKIAVNEIAPLLVVSFRLLFGLAGLLVVTVVTKSSLPSNRRILGKYLVLSVFATALPFVLISWGETRIDSGMAAVLNGTVPLFTVVLAHGTLSEEKVTLSRLGGLLVGFAGVMVLVSGSLGSSSFQASFPGQMAVLAASASYAVGIVFTRRFLRNQVPIVQSTMNLLFAASLTWFSTLATGQPISLPKQPVTWVALVWLGVLGSCSAYLLYFYLINSIGATRTSAVNYLLPLVGLMLGVSFLGEPLDWRLAAGLVLILSGIWVINTKWRTRPDLAPE